jgi:hypothetical protein
MLFLQLPEEIIQKIYTYLNYKEAKKLSYVNTKLKSIFNDIDKFTLYDVIKSFSDIKNLKASIENNNRFIEINNNVFKIINISNYITECYSIICREGIIIYINPTQNKIILRGNDSQLLDDKYNSFKIISYSKFIYKCKELKELNKKLII